MANGEIIPGKLLQWRGTTKLDIPVERVLDAAKKCSVVMIVGIDPEDDSLYYAASTGDNQLMLWLLEKCKAAVLDM